MIPLMDGDAGALEVPGRGASGKISYNMLDWEYIRSRYWARAMAYSSVKHAPITMSLAI